jgi:hypothetical protein
LAGGLAEQDPIELRETIRFDLALESVSDLGFAPRTKLHSDKLCRTRSHSVADVISSDHQVVAIVTPAAQDDVHVGVFRVPMIDCDPVELRPKIALRVPHQVARETLQVGELVSIIWRHNEPEMMPVAVATAGEAPMIDILLGSTEQASGGPVPGHALSAEVAEMSIEEAAPHAMADDARLDDGAAGSIGQAVECDEARRPTAPEGAAPAGAA